MAAKVYKNGRENPWDATLEEPVPLLIGMLVSDCILCPIGSQKKYEIVACIVNVWG